MVKPIRSPYQTGSIAPGTPIYHTNSLPEKSEMIDEVDESSHFKECYHQYTKNEYQYTRIPYASQWQANTNVSAMRVNASILSTLASVMPVPEYDWDALAEQAMAFLLPSINEGTSVLNFVAELHELKSLDPRDALRRVKYGSTTLRLLRDRKTRNGFLKDTAGRMANAHLQASFGIVPFLTDIVKMFDELGNLQHKVAMLKKHADRPLIRHYKRVLPYEDRQFWPRAYRESKVHPVSLPNLSGDPWVHPYWGIPNRETKTGNVARASTARTWIVRPVYHATLRYRYTMPRFDTEWGEQLALYTESLGIRLDPSIPWNAARLSFLVDWFADVSGFLGSFARENYPINSEVLDFCHSLKWHSEGSVSITEPQTDIVNGMNAQYTDWYPPGYQAGNPVEVLRTVDSHYERRRAKPTAQIIASKRLKLRQAALAGSLLLSNTSFLRKGKGQYRRLLPQTLRELQFERLKRQR